MTEEEWMSSDSPHQILETLGYASSDRKLRLFAVICCRRVLQKPRRDRWVMEGTKLMIDGLELLADGIAVEHWQQVVEAGLKRQDDLAMIGMPRVEADFHAVFSAIEEAPYPAAFDAALCANAWLDNLDWPFTADTAAGSPEAIIQSSLLRDIFGNPFRPVTFDPAWRTDAAVGIAQAAYDSREFGNLPVLADALQDAGCDHPDVLAHLRGPGPHVRGCWVVDLVLGKA